MLGRCKFVVELDSYALLPLHLYTTKLWVQPKVQASSHYQLAPAFVVVVRNITSVQLVQREISQKFNNLYANCYVIVVALIIVNIVVVVVIVVVVFLVHF